MARAVPRRRSRNIANPAPHAASFRTISERPQKRALGAARKAASNAALTTGRGIRLGAAWWRAYVKACIAAFTTILALGILFLGTNNPILHFSMVSLLAAIVIAPTASIMLLVPTILFTRALALAGVPRGHRDLMVGGLIGSLWFFAPLAASNSQLLMALIFLAGGLAGGYAFWRAQGFPGAKTDPYLARLAHS